MLSPEVKEIREKLTADVVYSAEDIEALCRLEAVYLDEWNWVRTNRIGKAGRNSSQEPVPPASVAAGSWSAFVSKLEK